jgi:hypothetical protein
LTRIFVFIVPNSAMMFVHLSVHVMPMDGYKHPWHSHVLTSLSAYEGKDIRITLLGLRAEFGSSAANSYKCCLFRSHACESWMKLLLCKKALTVKLASPQRKLELLNWSHESQGFSCTQPAPISMIRSGKKLGNRERWKPCEPGASVRRKLADRPACVAPPPKPCHCGGLH